MEFQRELRAAFRPEFLNRLDETIFFKPLDKGALNRIIALMLGGLRNRLEAQMLHLEVTDEAKAVLIEQGYDPVFGARPLRRVLQTKAETLIARKILSGALSGGDTITLDADGDTLVCQ